MEMLVGVIKQLKKRVKYFINTNHHYNVAITILAAMHLKEKIIRWVSVLIYHLMIYTRQIKKLTELIFNI